jgi:2-polyprenyl-6-methoxyphenol hydroxylase-like FAD-dependent oxidoreductase
MCQVSSSGAVPTIFHRSELLKVIYDNLTPAAQAKVLLGKELVSLSQDDDSVTVACADGSVCSGFILIGADGVHSKPREQMHYTALRANPTADWNREFPFTACY